MPRETSHGGDADRRLTLQARNGNAQPWETDMKQYDLGALPPKWRAFARCHEHADAAVIDPRAFGIDDQLDEMLAGLDTPPRTDEQLFTLRQNRARKHRHRRRQLLGDYARQRMMFDDTPPIDRLIRHDDIAVVRRHTTSREWRCLWLLARDESYATVAALLGLTPGTARSIVCRSRARLRLLITAA